MKIAMIISTAFPPEEGIGFYVYNLSKKLIENGHKVTVITRGSLKTQTAVFEGIKIIKVPFLPLYPFHVQFHGYFVNKLFNSIEDDFDIVHIHSPLTPVLKTSLPIITTLHGSMVGNAEDMEIVDLKSFGTKVLTKYISFPLVLKLINCSDVITTVSDPVKTELEKYYYISNVVVISNAVDEKKFVPNNKEGNYVLYVGRLSYGKGLFDLLATAKRIANLNVNFYLVGKGELRTNLEKRIKNENINNVKFLGSLKGEKLLMVYQNASIFFFPSHYEGFPTVVLEAMACGVPVLASDINAHKNFIENNKNGILFRKGSIEDAGQQISNILNNNELKEKLGKNARKTIEEYYTWDKISEKFEEIYIKLLSNGGTSENSNNLL